MGSLCSINRLRRGIDRIADIDEESGFEEMRKQFYKILM